MLSGVILGYLLRRHNLKPVSRLITLMIWALLFLLGLEVGHNERIIRGIATLGIEALWLTITGLGGSLILTCALWRWSNKGRRNK